MGGKRKKRPPPPPRESEQRGHFSWKSVAQFFSPSPSLSLGICSVCLPFCPAECCVIFISTRNFPQYCAHFLPCHETTALRIFLDNCLLACLNSNGISLLFFFSFSRGIRYYFCHSPVATAKQNRGGKCLP